MVRLLYAHQYTWCATPIYLVPTRRRGNAVWTRQRPFPATLARCSRYSHAAREREDEKILQIPYYVVFSRYTNEVQFLELIQGRYVKLPPTTKTLWIPKLQLGLGVWNGVYDNFERQWLRWQDAQGRWILTPVERERQRAVSAEQQILLEQERATQAEHRNQQLVAKLRALGIDPESL